MNKKLIVLSLLLTAFGLAQAQPTDLIKGTYGIDSEKKIIVVTGHGNSVGTLRVNGETYRIYRTTMPVINITTDGPIVNTPAVHGIISVADAEGSVVEMHAGFKIRGSSSQQFDKKSYRVELWADATGTVMADTTFLGMRSDDDWNLEAMYNQPLRLRNKIANELWREIYQLPYQSSEPEAASSVAMEYADVFVNDTYMGIYALSERVDRKLLGLRKYNGSLRGVLYKGNGPGAPSFDTLPDYDNGLDVWDQFEWVYPNETDTCIDWSSLYSLVNFVINASDNAFYSQYSTIFEEGNAIDYYIFINTLRAMDNMDRNTFIARYKKSSAYFYVPWDLDAILGNDNDGQHEDDVEGLKTNGFFNRLVDDCSTNGFANKLRTRYNSLRQGALSQSHIMEMIQNQYETLVAQGAYARESEAWPEYSVNEGEIDYIDDWLQRRLAYLDVEINSDCGTWEVDETDENAWMVVFPNPAHERINIRFGEAVPSVVRIYDMTGHLVYSGSHTAQSLTVSVQGFRSGIYSVLVQQQGNQSTQRLLIQ